jgi:flagella basal body P-ring formation protein FlgA
MPVTWIASLFVLAAAFAAGPPATAARRPSASPDVDAAIHRALQARLGPEAEITINEVQMLTRPARPVIDARLAPDARLGQTLHVRLATTGDRGTVAWTDFAEVRIRVAMVHAHAAHALSRGSEVADEDVETARHDMTEGPMARWPQASELVRGRALRDVAPGSCLGRTSVAAPLAVQNGQTVTAIARVGGVEATASLIAAGSGVSGAIIRVVNQQSRRVMRARVVSPGIVEIVP